MLALDLAEGTQRGDARKSQRRPDDQRIELEAPARRHVEQVALVLRQSGDARVDQIKDR